MSKRRRSLLPSLPPAGSASKRARPSTSVASVSRAIVIEDTRRRPKRSRAPVAKVYAPVVGPGGYTTPARAPGPIGLATPVLFPPPPQALVHTEQAGYDDALAGVVIEHDVAPQRTRKAGYGSVTTVASIDF